MRCISHSESTPLPATVRALTKISTDDMVQGPTLQISCCTIYEVTVHHSKLVTQSHNCPRPLDSE